MGAQQTETQMDKPLRKRYEDVTVKISRIANGYTVTELSTNVPHAYYELGLPDTPDNAAVTTVAEHLSRFFSDKE